jgi:hypothetical protein
VSAAGLREREIAIHGVGEAGLDGETSKALKP